MWKKSLATMLILIMLYCPVGFAGDWPKWRGPFHNGSTDEKNLPDTWSKTENIAWVSPLPGPSGATPIICNGRVFVSTTDYQSKNLLALCIDAKDGKELWRKKIGTTNRRWPRNDMASPSPVTNGKNVFFLYGSGELAALNYNGNIIWSRNIEKEYGNLALMFGYSSSPLLYNNILYILVVRRHTPYRHPESNYPLDSFLLALDPNTGKVLWKQQRKTEAWDEALETYSTPVIFEGNGRKEILIIGGDNITGHDPETGREIWRFRYSYNRRRDWRIIPSLVTGNNLIFAAKPKGCGLFALKTGGKGVLSDNYIAWTFDGPAPDCSTPLFYNGLLYILDGIRHGKVLSCLDPKTGRLKWQGKLGGRAPWRASLTGADGKLYCISEAAEIVVLAAGGKKFNILFRIALREKPTRSSIAVANGHLFIRTAKNLFCVGK